MNVVKREQVDILIIHVKCIKNAVTAGMEYPDRRNTIMRSSHINYIIIYSTSISIEDSSFVIGF